MYRWIQTEYRAPSIRVTRHNEYESLRIGLNHRSPWSITAPGPIPILAILTFHAAGNGRREDVDVDEEGGRSNENYFEPVLPHSTKTVAYGRPSTMTNHHRSRRDNARLHPSTPARFSRFAAFLGGRGEREAMPRKSRAMRCRTRGSSDAGNRWGGGRGTIPLGDRWNESRRWIDGEWSRRID